MSDDQPVAQWLPTPEDIAQAQLTAFADFVMARTGLGPERQQHRGRYGSGLCGWRCSSSPSRESPGVGV